jgi:hypothetical protein
MNQDERRSLVLAVARVLFVNGQSTRELCARLSESGACLAYR